METRLLIGCPSYDGRYQNLSAHLYAHNSDRATYHDERWSSTLTGGFNELWCHALNMRVTDGLTHFLLWHADVRPRGAKWLDVLFEELVDSEADVLSAIIPIKDEKGVTSTAFDLGQWRAVRLTQKQANSPELPDTWTAENLLINTGLMLVDFRKPWVEQICFQVHNKIEKDAAGTWISYFEPEDWNFSRQCRKLGVPMAVTRKVIVEHWGVKAFRSDEVWGSEIDPDINITGMNRQDIKLETVDAS